MKTWIECFDEQFKAKVKTNFVYFGAEDDIISFIQSLLSEVIDEIPDGTVVSDLGPEATSMTEFKFQLKDKYGIK